MELNKDFKSLIERAWSLHGRLNFEIQKNSNLCNFCSENGHFYCDIGYQKTPFLDTHRLVAIRDSVKELQNSLLSLQKLKAWQVSERDEALNRLQESRSVLMELVRNYRGKNPPEVLRDLNACFGDEDAIVARKSKQRSKKWFLSSLVNWKWKRSFGIAVKFLIFSVSISSMVKISHGRNLNLGLNLSSYSRRKACSSTSGSIEAEMRDNILRISRNPLDVFQARG